jgi:hypothetical protein
VQAGKANAVTTEVIFKISPFKVIEIADCPNFNFFRDLPDTGDAAYGKRKNKALIWSDRVNAEILWACCCRRLWSFSRTERAAAGADLSDD